MSADDPQVAPTLTTATPERERVSGQLEVINGTVKVRLTHPSLYRTLMGYAVGFLALGTNFLVFTPTFLVYGQPNEVWAVIFLVLGAGLLCFLNCFRSLRLMRLTMAVSAVYLLFFALGTSQPFLDGAGSLQLPILYVLAAGLLFLMLYEPFINPWSARRE